MSLANINNQAPYTGRKIEHWARRLQRCLRVLRWTIRLFSRYFYIRRQITTHMGKQWLQQQLTSVHPRQILNSSVQTIRVAWSPSIQQNASRRTRRIQQILSQLDSLDRPSYLITTRGGQRVYFAALLRCINAICQQQISLEALEAIHGPLKESTPTSISAYMQQWLRRCLARQPQMWSDPVPTPRQHFSSHSEDQARSVREGSVAKSTVAHQAQHEYAAALDSAALAVADQELYSLMVEHELKILALPTAVLEACRRSKAK